MSKLADLELGNMMFNVNANQVYECPNYIIALLRDIDRKLGVIMWNKEHREYDSPFDNTGNTFKLNNFEIQAYNWNDEESQDYNFIYRVDKTRANMPDLKISWYKYLGRDTTINQEIDENVVVSIYNDIMQQLDVYRNEVENSERD